MKQIPLTKGKFALVDDADFEWLNQWKWHSSHGYAVRNIAVSTRKQKKIIMHQIIIGKREGTDIDHIDMNKLNNQRDNLRHASRAENNRNTRSRLSSSSKFKGVSWYKFYKKWRAVINFEKKQINLGYFLSEVEAANAYNAAAIKYHGEFARLNVI